MIAALATACAIVWPVHDTGFDHGRRVMYRDLGDRIVYSRPVSRAFRSLVEDRTGRGVRIACDGGRR